MFKKPLSGLKTSAPLRSSDRRKLKQRVITEFGISTEDGDLLVPEGILSVKFSTHLDDPGTAYLGGNGDPLWFSVGKGSDDLIPTVYTLWKRRDLLPFLSTPAAVIPVLVGGADLMIPGVIHHSSSVNEGQLVSILQYNHHKEQASLSPPLAVGRMALPSNELAEGRKEKGKAVHVLHTWKDHLWDMGSKADAPEATPLNQSSGDIQSPVDMINSTEVLDDGSSTSLVDELSNLSLEPSYSAQEISTLLHTSLVQAIAATIPSSAFPIPSTLLYTNYILPCRPAFPASVLQTSGPSSRTNPSSQDINIKASSYKSLTAFLKSEEKASLLTLKSPPKHSQQADLLVTSVNISHPSVVEHRNYVTLKEIEARTAKKIQREVKAREDQTKAKDVEVVELWKPHQTTVNLFEGMGGNPAILYTLLEVKSLLNNYISSKSLVNPHEQAYINLDSLFVDFLSTKPKVKSKGKEAEVEPSSLEFMKREELSKYIMERMQGWHEVRAGGNEVVRKKGLLKPIQVVIKIRQGRKASTLITGFEPFLVINADDMAEDLRKVCAGATSVSPVPGKPANSGLEVLVQGKQSQAVVDYLTGRGIPKKWIEVLDVSGKK